MVHLLCAWCVRSTGPDTNKQLAIAERILDTDEPADPEADVERLAELVVARPVDPTRWLPAGRVDQVDPVRKLLNSAVVQVVT